QVRYRCRGNLQGQKSVYNLEKQVAEVVEINPFAQAEAKGQRKKKNTAQRNEIGVDKCDGRAVSGSYPVHKIQIIDPGGQHRRVEAGRFVVVAYFDITLGLP